MLTREAVKVKLSRMADNKVKAGKAAQSLRFSALSTEPPQTSVRNSVPSPPPSIQGKS